jgi:hypothetical protein
MTFCRGQSPGHSAHIGQEVEVHYRWHALYGRRLRRQYVEPRGGGDVVHVEITPGLVIVVAAWMLDPAACTGMSLGAPRVKLAALAELYQLLVERGFRRSSASRDRSGFDPDLRIQAVVRLIFARFRQLGSARQVFLSMVAEQVHFPRPSDGKKLVALDWAPIRYRNVISVLKNPFYAGVYAYGKGETRTEIVDGRPQKSYGHRKPLESGRFY